MADPSNPTGDRDPHFIGWLPMPRAYTRFLVPVAVALTVASAVIAGLVARGQRSPGAARWDDDPVTTFEGIAYAEPYAMIRVADDAGDTPATILLVEEGKHGAAGRARAHDGRPVRVGGTVLRRDGRQMLELLPGDDGLRAVEMAEERAAKLRRTPPVSLGRVTLRGEIVDSKCHLGAMKPGDGTTHKGCAVLCLRGGVPPLFISRDTAGRPAYHLMVSAAGGPLDPTFFDRVGEPVVLSADREQWGDLPVLKLAPPE